MRQHRAGSSPPGAPDGLRVRHRCCRLSLARLDAAEAEQTRTAEIQAVAAADRAAVDQANGEAGSNVKTFGRFGGASSARVARGTERLTACECDLDAID